MVGSADSGQTLAVRLATPLPGPQRFASRSPNQSASRRVDVQSGLRGRDEGGPPVETVPAEEMSELPAFDQIPDWNF
jgi:hypothetical protein